jgi:hypothetical protein
VENLQASDAECGAVVDHLVACQSDANGRHQVHEMAHDIQACPVVTGGEGRHGKHYRRLA